jgi:hypothetical protein
MRWRSIPTQDDLFAFGRVPSGKLVEEHLRHLSV